MFNTLACYVSLSRRYKRKVLPRPHILSMTFKKYYVASMRQSVPIKKNREVWGKKGKKENKKNHKKGLNPTSQIIFAHLGPEII